MEDHPLILLRELSNQDKHRVLAIVTLATHNIRGDLLSRMPATIEVLETHIDEPLTEGSLIYHARVRTIVGPSERGEMRIAVKSKLSIERWAPSRFLVAHRYVLERIVPRFERFFP